MDQPPQMKTANACISAPAVQRAVILAAGLGKRMRRTDPQVHLETRQDTAASAGLKAMIPFDRPFLDYVLTPLADAGITEVCLVIGPQHDEIRRYYGCPGISERLHITFAVQQNPRGTADALLAAETFTHQEPFLVMNSDNYYPLSAIASLCQRSSPGVVGYLRRGMLHGSNITAERLCQFAVIKSNMQGELEMIIEKPSSNILSNLPEPVLLSMNSWRFDNHIFDACRATQPSARGELELPEAVMISMRKYGVRYGVVMCDEPVLDLSQRSDIQAVAEHLSGLEVRL